MTGLKSGNKHLALASAMRQHSIQTGGLDLEPEYTLWVGVPDEKGDVQKSHELSLDYIFYTEDNFHVVDVEKSIPTEVELCKFGRSDPRYCGNPSARNASDHFPIIATLGYGLARYEQAMNVDQEPSVVSHHNRTGIATSAPAANL